MGAAKSRGRRRELGGADPEWGRGRVNGLAKAEIGDAETLFEGASEMSERSKRRAENFFMGNAIRGMLLNAYGWWLVGLIAKVAGAALIGAGGVLAGLGFRPAPRRR